MGEGCVDGGVVDSCALEEQPNWSRWSAVPEPLASFDVSASWHGNAELWRLVVLLGSRSLLFGIDADELLQFYPEVWSFYQRSSEITDPFVKDPVPWVGR